MIIFGASVFRVKVSRSKMPEVKDAGIAPVSSAHPLPDLCIPQVLHLLHPLCRVGGPWEPRVST